MAHDTNPQGRRDQQQPFFWTKKDKRTEQKCAKNVLKWPRWSKGKGHNATLCFSWALCSLSKNEPIYLVYICITFSLEIMYIGILLPKLFWPTVRKIVLVIEKNFWNLRLKAENLQIFEITRTIYSNGERSEQFFVTECYLFLKVSHI